MPIGKQEETNLRLVVVKGLCVLLGIMLPVGILMMLTDYGKQYLWTTSLFLGFESLALVLILSLFADIRSSIVIMLLLFILSFGIEYSGVVTGLPFGNYSYPGVLIPKVGPVPLAISFAWFNVIVTSVLVVKRLLPDKNSIALTAIAASVVVLAQDMLLEPFAALVNKFWFWHLNKVPLQNFVSWLVIGFIFSMIVLKLAKWKQVESYDNSLYKFPIIIFCINISNFSFINLYGGFILFTIAGLSVIASMYLLLSRGVRHEA